ncbi:MAG: adenylyltransferase/cytidyltransferase family protein [Patescibacteria group bacterium]|nr:adenylyltransferase/cytidyltransferase family protein [Patescibacteria group bacterium]
MVQKIFTQLENLAFNLQHWYMKPKMTRERVSRHYAFFHPRPTGKLVLDAYRQRTRIILVTGVFDLLHLEHKKLLQAAKNLGGVLLVGVETDRRVKQLKGDNRPVNPLFIRLQNLRRLRLADKIFNLPEKFNNQSDFAALIRKLKPDILAVSASTPNLVVKRRIMKRFDGRVVIVLAHNPKVSTSKMLKLNQ